MKKRLEDKAIIVVGAGTRGEGVGNGKAAAIQFARDGAKVLCVDRDESAAEITTNIIRDEGGRAEICVADIVNPADCAHVVETCLRHFNKIDVLHNNVGFAVPTVLPSPGDNNVTIGVVALRSTSKLQVPEIHLPKILPIPRTSFGIIVQ